MFSNRRSRNLLILAGAAVISLALAYMALHHRESMVAPKYAPHTVFPGLAHALNAGEVTHIRIASTKGAFTVAFVPAKGWVLPERDSFPASFEVVKQTLVALAALESVEPKTDDPALYHYVDLDAPPKGNGVAVTLTGDKGKVIAALVVGKTEMIGSDVGLFIRKAGDKQSWLVRSPAEIKANPTDWMDKSVVAVSSARVASVEVSPASGPAYMASRATDREQSFSVTPLPKGRELAYPGAADSAASALADFGFDDIRRSTDFDFNGSARMVVHTFDGLAVTVDLVQKDGLWARIFATAEPGRQPAAKEALTINAHTVGWAFKLPSYKAPLFAPALDTLLKPKT